jgi:SAM-dependent methyltransferase
MEAITAPSLAAAAGGKSRSTLRSYTGGRPDVAALVPGSARRILDVGCSNGRVGHDLKLALGAEVWGIEYDPDFAAVAEEVLDRVICADAAVAAGELRGEQFDCIVCADVLEHMPNPEVALERLARLVGPGGHVVVSLPNVRFYDTLVQLGFRGTWPRRDRGVHDRTHLQWYTDSDARAAFADAGLRVVHQTANYRLKDGPGRINKIAPLFARGPLRPFLAYQYLYRLAPA